MREVNYEALREAAQNYQSTLAWYQATPDSPNAERDCDAALAAFKRHIRHREADIIAGSWFAGCAGSSITDSLRPSIWTPDKCR
ncbi:hypothetical protein ECH27V05_00504 [Escherichia coli O145:H28]|nr:hypothetical protein ECDEC4A_2129 [Escherichia coli DEC4A]EIN90138.1 protein ea22 [Escherichia coli PA22]BCZ67033.1 hypothetical protein EC12E115_2019 [Escherichia coli O145:H28]GDH24692.1 hypothetical protein BvCmsKKP005_00396 [Escherichia coli]BCZ72457.1 hypothetical protein EC16003_1957 [Escherichia coli O145:H28]